MSTNKRALVNILYHQSPEMTEPGKIIIIEVVNGQKQFRVIDDPDITFNISKLEFIDKHATEELVFLPVEEVEEFTCKYHTMFGSMYKLLERDPNAVRKIKYQKIFKRAYQNRNMWDFRKLHSHPMFHGSDIDIVDHYIDRWYEEFDVELDRTYSLKKAYFDIEVDTYKLAGFPEPELAPRPINAITYFFKETGRMWIGITPNSQFINEAMEQLVPLQQYIADKFFEKYADDKDLKLAQYNTMKSCDMEFVETELDLVRKFLYQVNEVDRPDVISAFNIHFDFNTIFNRLKNVYSIPPASLFCPEDFQSIRNAYYYEDKRAKDITEKKDYILVNGYTIWQDQMLNYARLRKSDRKDSWSLDATAKNEINANKIDLAPYNITDVYYKNPELFIDYSGNDTLHLSRIEDNTGDLDILYALHQITRTRFDKVLTKTTSLRNMAAVFFRRQGQILSNNKNMNKLVREDKIKIKFRGAFVACPNLMSPVGLKINGRRLRNIFKLVFDLDLSSLVDIASSNKAC